MGAGTEVSQLECRHVAYLSPSPSAGDVVYCRDCRKYRAVLHPHMEWSWYCHECRSGRRYAMRETTCKQAALSHLVRFSAHTVLLKKAGQVVERWTGPQPDKLF